MKTRWMGRALRRQHPGRKILLERLWRTVKHEEMYLKTYDNATEARRELGAYLRFCNNQGSHQALGYRTPARCSTRPGMPRGRNQR